MDCLFCKIIHNQIPANISYRDSQLVAFDDINPQSPHHKLIVPIKHIVTLNALQPEDKELMGSLVLVASKLADELKIAEEGYRLVINCNSGAGQTVFHIHAHLLGGRQLGWPPG